VWRVEINRNQYFMIGMVVLILGLQVRAIDTYVLNEKTSRFLAERFSPLVTSIDTQGGNLMPAVGPTPLRTVHPPVWLGYALISVGAVLILHSLAMKRPGA